LLVERERGELAGDAEARPTAKIVAQHNARWARIASVPRGARRSWPLQPWRRAPGTVAFDLIECSTASVPGAVAVVVFSGNETLLGVGQTMAAVTLDGAGAV